MVITSKIVLQREPEIIWSGSSQSQVSEASRHDDFQWNHHILLAPTSLRSRRRGENFPRPQKKGGF